MMVLTKIQVLGIMAHLKLEHSLSLNFPLLSLIYYQLYKTFVRNLYNIFFNKLKLYVQLLRLI